MTTTARRSIWSPSLENPTTSSSINRSQSVEPSLLTRSISQSTGNRPSFSSYSSFSSQFTNNSHARSNSQSGEPTPTQQQHQQKWIPRSKTPNPNSTHKPSNSGSIPKSNSHNVRTRERSGTGSSSSTSSSQGQTTNGSNYQQRPQSRLAMPMSGEAADSQQKNVRHQHRKSSSASTTNGPLVDNFKGKIHEDAVVKYKARVKEAQGQLQERLRSLQGESPNGGSQRPTSRAARRNSSSFFSLPGSERRERDKERERLVAEHERNIQELEQRMQEEERILIKREEKRRKRAASNAARSPSGDIMPSKQPRGVVVEDEVSPSAEPEEWLWRPDMGEREFNGQHKEKLREEVRKEQEAILESIRRANVGANGNSEFVSPISPESNAKKVRWGSHQQPPRPLSTIPSASAVPTLPPTPHTAHLLLQQQQQQQQRGGSPFTRAASTGPGSGFNGSLARMSPVVTTAPGMARPLSSHHLNRPMSARPASPAQMPHARWIPSVNEYAADMRISRGSGAKPVQIPGGRNGHQHSLSGSVGTDGTGSDHGVGAGAGSVGNGSLSGSWRDWKMPPPAGTGVGNARTSQTLAHALEDTNKAASGNNSNSNNSWGRRAMTPAPPSSHSSRFGHQTTGSNELPRKRTLSFSSASASAAAAAAMVKEQDNFKPKPPSKSLQKTKGVVDDRDNETLTVPVNGHAHTPSPAIPSEDLVLMPLSAPSDAPVSSKGKDKGKGKARAPPTPPPAIRSPILELASGFGGVKGLFAAQVEDLAGQLRRELGVGA